MRNPDFAIAYCRALALEAEITYESERVLVDLGIAPLDMLGHYFSIHEAYLAFKTGIEEKIAHHLAAAEIDRRLNAVRVVKSFEGLELMRWNAIDAV